MKLGESFRNICHMFSSFHFQIEEGDKEQPIIAGFSEEKQKCLQNVYFDFFSNL